MEFDKLFLFCFLVIFATGAEAKAKCDTTNQPCSQEKPLFFKDVYPDGLTLYWCCPSDQEHSWTGRENECSSSFCFNHLPTDSKNNPCPVRHFGEAFNNKIVEKSEIFREACEKSPTNGMEDAKGFKALCCNKNTLENQLTTIGGAELHEFPHLARLEGPDLCAGAIYNEKFIITAAHCVVDRDKRVKVPSNLIKVHLGTNIGTDNPSPLGLYKVKRTIVHEKYPYLIKNAQKKDIFDVALIEVQKPIQFGDNIKAVRIAPKNFNPMEFATSAILPGWGYTDTKKIPVPLQKATLLIHSDDLCYPKKSQEEKDQFLCLGGQINNTWSPNPSKGDSGGPAMCRGPLGRAVHCGIVSHGGFSDQCVDNNNEEKCYPGKFEDVSYFRDWIIKNAGDQDESVIYEPFLFGQEVTDKLHQVKITSRTGRSCGGTLVAKNVVVTAAQCVFKEFDREEKHEHLRVTTQSGKRLRASEVKKYDGESSSRRRRLIYHTDQSKPSKNRKFLETKLKKDDLAMVKLSEEVDGNIKFPEIPKESDELSEGVELSNPLGKSETLRARDFKILTKEDCQNRLERIPQIAEGRLQENILYGVEKYSGGSVCDRDLGGGLICKGKRGKEVLCGVQVFRACESSIPNGFINMSKTGENTLKQWEN